MANRLAERNDSERPLPPMLVFKSTVDATVSNNAVVDPMAIGMDVVVKAAVAEAETTIAAAMDVRKARIKDKTKSGTKLETRIRVRA